MARLLRLLLVVGCALALPGSLSVSAQPAPGATVRVSVNSSGQEGNYLSANPSISANGRFVAFQSASTNLVSNDTKGFSDIFVHDLRTGETERVSVSSQGEEGNNDSVNPSISADGRYVAFMSYASNLVDGDESGFQDVFVYDRETDKIERVSVSSNGAEGNQSSEYPFISADGRYVAFHSLASNLVDGDTNEEYDVFVHDRQTGKTTRVSVSSTGQEGNGWSMFPSISADGRLVAFYSVAPYLVDFDDRIDVDVFVHNRLTGVTERVGYLPALSIWFFELTEGPSISANGRFVAFKSYVSSSPPRGNVLVYDLKTGQTEQVSVSSDGQEGNDTSGVPSISADGRYVAFTSLASNLVSGDNNGWFDIFVRDRRWGGRMCVETYLPLVQN